MCTLRYKPAAAAGSQQRVTATPASMCLLCYYLQLLEPPTAYLVTTGPKEYLLLQTATLPTPVQRWRRHMCMSTHIRLVDHRQLVLCLAVRCAPLYTPNGSLAPQATHRTAHTWSHVCSVYMQPPHTGLTTRLWQLLPLPPATATCATTTPSCTRICQAPHLHVPTATQATTRSQLGTRSCLKEAK